MCGVPTARANVRARVCARARGCSDGAAQDSKGFGFKVLEGVLLELSREKAPVEPPPAGAWPRCRCRWR